VARHPFVRHLGELEDEIHLCAYCGELEPGRWVPVPPYRIDHFGFTVGYTEEIFMGWTCLENNTLTRAERVADICQRPHPPVARRHSSVG
jgi:hypothetical protein